MTSLTQFLGDANNIYRVPHGYRSHRYREEWLCSCFSTCVVASSLCSESSAKSV